MDFQRHIEPRKSLNIGIKALKRQKIQSLMYRDSILGVWLGMGEIIELIKKTRDVEYLELFKEDFIEYFAIPQRKGEKWRWEELYEIIPQFPNRGVFKAHGLISDIVATFAHIK